MGSQTIPEHATLVHSGPSFRIYQREQELFDGSYRTFELALLPDVVKILLVDQKNQKVLVVHDEQPGLSRITLPGGLVEDGEDLLETASREVQEETGYTYNNILPRFSLPFTNRVNGTRHYYIAKDLTQGSITNPDKGSEKITLLWKTFDEFIEQICAPEEYSDLSDYLIKNYILSKKQEELKTLLFGSPLGPK